MGVKENFRRNRTLSIQFSICFHHFFHQDIVFYTIFSFRCKKIFRVKADFGRFLHQFLVQNVCFLLH